MLGAAYLRCTYMILDLKSKVQDQGLPKRQQCTACYCEENGWNSKHYSVPQDTNSRCWEMDCQAEVGLGSGHVCCMHSWRGVHTATGRMPEHSQRWRGRPKRRWRDDLNAYTKEKFGPSIMSYIELGKPRGDAFTQLWDTMETNFKKIKELTWECYNIHKCNLQIKGICRFVLIFLKYFCNTEACKVALFNCFKDAYKLLKRKKQLKSKTKTVDLLKLLLVCYAFFLEIRQSFLMVTTVTV